MVELLRCADAVVYACWKGLGLVSLGHMGICSGILVMSMKHEHGHEHEHGNDIGL